MKYLASALFILCLCLSACGTEEDSQSASNTPDTQASEATNANTDEADDSSESQDETSEDSEIPGTSGTSCGSPSQGLEPVDCTMHGDTEAFCIYGNHCFCNIDAGFECEAPLMGDDLEECAPGSVCVPIN